MFIVPRPNIVREHASPIDYRRFARNRVSWTASLNETVFNNFDSTSSHSSNLPLGPLIRANFSDFSRSGIDPPFVATVIFDKHDLLENLSLHPLLPASRHYAYTAVLHHFRTFGPRSQQLHKARISFL